MEELKTSQNHAGAIPGPLFSCAIIAGAPAALRALVRFLHWWSASLAIQGMRIRGPVLAKPGEHQKAMRALKGLDASILGEDFNQHLGLHCHAVSHHDCQPLHLCLVPLKSFEFIFSILSSPGTSTDQGTSTSTRHHCMPSGFLGNWQSPAGAESFASCSLTEVDRVSICASSMLHLRAWRCFEHRFANPLPMHLPLILQYPADNLKIEFEAATMTTPGVSECLFCFSPLHHRM